MYDDEYEKEPTTTDQLHDMIFDLETTLIERDEKFEEIMDEFQKIDPVIKMTRTMKDFHLVKLNFDTGRYVKGIAEAFDITEDRRILALTDKTHSHK